MIKSMTGYGKSTMQIGLRQYQVEIKSVNHRYSDVNIKMPRVISYLEEDVKKQILFYVMNCKIVISDINDINLKQRFWISCSNLSWDFTVRLRNLLGIGL